MTVKRFEHVLIGRIQNDPIEHRASVSRHLGSNNLSLEVCAFYHNEITLLLRLIRKLWTNKECSHNRISHKTFFNEVQSMI